MSEKINKSVLNYSFISTTYPTEMPVTRYSLINQAKNDKLIVGKQCNSNRTNDKIDMKLIKKITLLMIVSLTASFSIAQLAKKESIENNYKVVHWDVDNGLSQDEVYAMIKDVNGFFYDIKADTFRNFPSLIPDQPIVPFWATKDEIFCWDYAESGLTAYNIHSLAKKTLVKFTPAETDSLRKGVSSQYAIFDAESNSVWMEKGIPSWRGGTGGGLLQVSLTNGKRKEFTWSCYRKIPNHTHFSEGMRYDCKRNSIWINSPDGLLEFTLNDKQFHHIDLLNEFLNPKDFGQAGIDIDPRGRIWVATEPAGIIIYDPTDNSSRLAFPNDSALQKTISNANASIYCDRDGITWSGFWLRKGIYQLIPFSQTVTRYTADAGKPHSLSNNEVYNCINGNHGKVWIGTFEGLNIFDPQTGLFQVFHEKDLPGMEGKGIHLIFIDTVLQKAWLSNHEPPVLYEMDIRTRKCRPIIFKDSTNKTISSVHNTLSKQYKRGCVVVAAYENQQGVFIVNADSAVAQQVLSFPNETINQLNTTEDDHLLFLRRPNGMRNLTYTDLNGKWIQTPNALDTIQWRSILFSVPDQTYWVVVEMQLIHYNKDFHMIRRYTQEDGLPVDEIHGGIVDNNGNFWFNTDREIYRFEVKTEKIIMLTEKDGFKSQNFTGTSTPCIKDAYGNLYFPCGRIWGQGFDIVNPDKLQRTYPPSLAYLQSVRVNQKPFPLSTGINNLQQLSLKYFQNKITIETGVIDYYSKGKNQIRYKLEGLNKDWQYAPASYTVRYDALPSGTYKLMMQASNAADQFNSPVKILVIQISPAFWNTWWFRTIAAICILAAFYGLIRYRAHQKFRLQLERSEKEKQLAQLQQQKTEQKMQAQAAQIKAIVATQEEERKRISRDLHDDIGTKLSALNLYLSSLSEKATVINNDEIKSLARSSKQIIKEAMHDVRQLLLNLSPTVLEEFGYTTAVEGLVNKINETHMIHFNFVVFGIKQRLQKDYELALYRITQELINNVLKHARAKKVFFQIEQRDEKIILMMEDDGIGFDVNAHKDGYGLKNLDARTKLMQGIMTIDSQPGKGTSVLIEIPYNLMDYDPLSINYKSMLKKKQQF